MDIDKFISLYEQLEEMGQTEKRWVYINLNHIIERFNEKFNKSIELFDIE